MELAGTERSELVSSPDVIGCPASASYLSACSGSSCLARAAEHGLDEI